ncbi:sigma-70 family RNA polymerase sigma factor [Pseudomonas aeruginosa]|uniref:RNA polymerase sigma factor n=2 Tax=Stutzerimonas stutzeri TaxID=316 RepID=A4VG40_STUS1|nr:sigma-70 family RNA polymerase sigma factor [Stutzerimonas stutzeri]ABP77941.1 sigma-70 factor region 2 [Stutzerimonas stutzeri A1501]MBA1307360.1 sigma-70 family RNA polymerase sigma factor [Stutzerimonas stutzeri]MBI7165300.1 sigma-70 family RNA polymerase sigma factor [Pseudomonas aeruginosa]UWG60798.1 sigma-70 family RNA polymerase sigma factor [Stutzerimonas stutzeri]
MAGSNTSFECVLRAWEAHERELLAFLILRARDRNAAEDLLQEVFLKAMRQGKGFCSLENPRAWLFQVARNAVVDATRLAKPNAELTDELAESLVASPTSERVPVDELDACVERNLPALEAEDRHIIAACDLQGQTVRAYAEANQLTLAAAKSRLLRARKRLRDSLIVNCQVRFDDTGQVCCHTPRPSA